MKIFPFNLPIRFNLFVEINFKNLYYGRALQGYAIKTKIMFTSSKAAYWTDNSQNIPLNGCEDTEEWKIKTQPTQMDAQNQGMQNH